MIVIVDYGLGNLASVRNAFRVVGSEVRISSNPEDIRTASGIVLPGVGAAAAGMERLQTRGLTEPIREAAGAGTPTLAICLGMQLLFDRSEEGDAACLGLIAGTVRSLTGTVKKPHIGWNQVDSEVDSGLFRGIGAAPYFYFVHSFVCEPADPGIVAGTTEYGGTFCSAVRRGRIWGTQFHPERSGRAGLRLIANFVEACESDRKIRQAASS